MRKKRDCLGCRALFYNDQCSLGYDIEHKDYYMTDGKKCAGSFLPAPSEVCPKPKTYKEFVNAENKRGGE